MRQLIVNADDLGLCDSVNRGILQAAQHGLVTSASVMANGRAFEGAVAHLQAYPTLDVGVHLVLVEEQPLLLPERLKCLVTDRGRLPRTWVALLGRLAASRVAVQEAERECRAQIERVLAAGLRPSHVDSHQHVHLMPSLWRLVVELASEYGIPWVRGLRGACRLRATALGDWRRVVSRWPLVACAGLMGWSHRRRHDDARTDMMTLGVIESGHLTEPTLVRLLATVKEGVTELVCHPGHLSQELVTQYAHWGYQWSDEVAALTSPAVQMVARQSSMVLTDFRALAASHGCAVPQSRGVEGSRESLR